MKEFNLAQALAGAKIIDKNGDIGEYKMTNIHSGIKTHIFQFIVNNKEDQAIISYKEGTGWFYGFGKHAERCEEYIFMAPVKKQEWRNIQYNLDRTAPTGQFYTIDDIPFESEEAAQKYAEHEQLPNYVKSILIREWEE